jgi:hypothetical protein
VNPLHHPGRVVCEMIHQDMYEIASDVALLMGRGPRCHRRLLKRIDAGRRFVFGNRQTTPLTVGDLRLMVASDLRILLAELEA